MCNEGYYSLAGENGEMIEDEYNLHANVIKSANGFVTCDNISMEAPICVPPGLSKGCKSVHFDTCETLDATYDLAPGTVLRANRYLTCSTI